MYRIIGEKPGVEDGKRVRHIIVSSVDDLSDIPSDTAPSSIAHTVGYGSAWELGLDGDWHEVSVPSQDLMYRFGTDNGLPYIEG